MVLRPWYSFSKVIHLLSSRNAYSANVHRQSLAEGGPATSEGPKLYPEEPEKAPKGFHTSLGI